MLFATHGGLGHVVTGNNRASRRRRTRAVERCRTPDPTPPESTLFSAVPSGLAYTGREYDPAHTLHMAMVQGTVNATHILRHRQMNEAQANPSNLETESNRPCIPQSGNRVITPAILSTSLRVSQGNLQQTLSEDAHPALSYFANLRRQHRTSPRPSSAHVSRPTPASASTSAWHADATTVCPLLPHQARPAAAPAAVSAQAVAVHTRSTLGDAPIATRPPNEIVHSSLCQTKNPLHSRPHTRSFGAPQCAQVMRCLHPSSAYRMIPALRPRPKMGASASATKPRNSIYSSSAPARSSNFRPTRPAATQAPANACSLSSAPAPAPRQLHRFSSSPHTVMRLPSFSCSRSCCSCRRLPHSADHSCC